MKKKSFIDLKLALLWASSLLILILMLFTAPQGILDSRLYYSGGEAAQFLLGLSIESAASYLLNEFLDLGLILSYTASLYLGLRRVSQKAWPAFIPGAFDLIETGTIILYLLGVVEIDHFNWLGLISLSKWISGGMVAGYFIFKIVRRTSEEGL